MTITSPDLISTVTAGWADATERWAEMSRSMWDDSQAMWQQWAGARDVTGAGTRRAGRHHPAGRQPYGDDRRHEHGHPHHRDHHGAGHHRDDEHPDRGCGCGADCGCDECRCCVPAADVVVHARTGERRVVPFLLRNHRRREREVTLDVGPWQQCGDDGLQVIARWEQTEITLQACEDRVIRLLIAVGADHPDQYRESAPASAKGARSASSKAKRAAEDEVDEADEVSVIRVPDAGADLERCASAYADVRFEGCARPQRVAVVVAPAHCDAIEAGCDCGCC